MRTAGIIGGLGPETTAQFYLELSLRFQNFSHNSRPPVLIWSVPIDYQVESEAIQFGNRLEECREYVVSAAKILRNAGADFLVMPCNTLHIFIEDMRREVDIPILSIIEETSLVLSDLQSEKVGILATGTTLNSQIFTKALKGYEITPIVPDNDQQDQINAIIHNLVRGKRHYSYKKKIEDIITEMSERHSIRDSILACTDLQLLNLSSSRVRLIDTFSVLVDSTLRELMK